MTKVFATVLSKNGERNVWLEIDEERNLLSWNCTCDFGSWHRWAGIWRKRGTICKHAKAVCKKLNISIGNNGGSKDGD